jgi:hypothetical protein
MPIHLDDRKLIFGVRVKTSNTIRATDFFRLFV